MGPEISPADYAVVLLRHHDALRQIDLDAPHFTDRVAGALSAVNDREQSPELPDSDRELLIDTLGGLRTAISAEKGGDQLLHGEPHPGNLLSTRRGLLFADLATCCRGLIVRPRLYARRSGADDQMHDRGHWRVEGLSHVRAALDRCGLG